MNDGDVMQFRVPEPGRWVTYQWIVSTIDDPSVSCSEETGRYSIKNVGMSDCGHCWCEAEFVRDATNSAESLLFKFLVDPQKLSDQRVTPLTGWFQYNSEPTMSFKTFRPNHYPELCNLMQQVCGAALFPLRGAIARNESLDTKTIRYSNGQIDCFGTFTVAVKDFPIDSEQTLRVTTDCTIWCNAAIPFYAIAESHVTVDHQLFADSVIPVEPNWTSALHLSELGCDAVSCLLC